MLKEFFKAISDWLKKMSRIRRNKKVFGQFFQDCSCPECRSWNFLWREVDLRPVEFKCLDCRHTYKVMVVLR